MDAALDLFVYAPVGLVLAAVGEVPKLAAVGRAAVDDRLASARVVGRFALVAGRRQIERRLTAALANFAGGMGPTRVSDDAGSGCGPSLGVTTRPARAPSDAAGSRPPVQAGMAPAQAGTAGMAPAQGGTAGMASAQDGTARTAPAAKGSGAAKLAIPGYDSLSASQVVQRLAGLDDDELRAVRTYEATNRGRRTILSRAEQLQRPQP